MPMFNSIVYRTDDLSQWGYGQGSDLSAVQIDNNFWNLNVRVSTLETTALGKQIAYAMEADGALWIVYTDHSMDGPFPLPIATIEWRGVWQPNTSYTIGDIIYYQGGIYFTSSNFTSGSTFATHGSTPPAWLILMLLIPAIPSSSVATATFTPDITFMNTFVRCTNPTGCAVTIPDDDEVNWVPDCEMHWRDVTQSGGGITWIGGGATILNGMEGRTMKTAGPGAVIGMKHIGVSEWDVWGLLQSAF